MNMAKWQDIITDDFDVGYSAIAEDIAEKLWQSSLIEISTSYSLAVSMQCETLLTTALLEALKIEEEQAIEKYHQHVLLGINKQKEH